MHSFWSYISNGEYSIGCTGQTVYLYDREENELQKFKDLKYAYSPAFSPKGDIFVVKTVGGMLGVYSLEERKLIKKFRFSKVDHSQDDGFSFSTGGELFYNIERHGNPLYSVVSVYDTSDFSLKKRLFEENHDQSLSQIEFDKETGDIFVIGFFRKNSIISLRGSAMMSCGMFSTSQRQRQFSTLNFSG